MITSSVLLIFLGSFFLYNTSRKVVLENNLLIGKWVQNNVNVSKIIGLVLLILALIITINKLGITSGIIFWLVGLMTILCLMIVLFPLKKINYKHLIAFFISSFLIELFI